MADLEETGKPILLYVTVTDPKKIKKIKLWEEAQLSKDNVIIGTKVCDCYMVDVKELNKEDPLVQAIGKVKAPGFYTFLGGKFLYKADGMPKSQTLYTCLKKTVKKAYKANLDKVVRAVVDIDKDIEKIENKKTLIQQKMARLKDGDKKKKSALAEMQVLLTEENKLNSKKNVILDLEGQRLKKKEVSKG